MSVPEFERMLGAVLPSICKTSVTLTEVPDGAGLLSMLQRAVAFGDRRRTPLTGVQLPLALFPELSAGVGSVPVIDSGDAGVVRLIFEP